MRRHLAWLTVCLASLTAAPPPWEPLLPSPPAGLGRRPPAALTVTEAEAPWGDLASDDPAHADRPLFALAGDPGRAVPLLRERLLGRTTKPLTADRVTKLIEALDSDDFATRQRSQAALENLCPQALPAVRKALERPASLEVRRRLGQVVKKFDHGGPPPEELRAARAVHVLEEIGTAETVALLEQLAAVEPDGRQAREAASALAQLAKRQAPPFAAPKWAPLFAGVDLADLKADKPRLMRGHAVRIDLRADGVSFLATPANGDRPGETDGLKTSTFLAKHRCQLAINAAPFGPIHKEEGKAQTISGLTVSRGDVVSKDKDGRPALLLTKDNKATIAAPPFDLKGVYNAVSGFQIVLQMGEVKKTNDAVHPRTAAGVSADGQTLYLLVIDGRQKGFSDGATTEEVGVWLKALGCSEGINLDGGGTTTLVVEGKDGKPRVVNRPIHAGKPGTERVSASHLGVFARPR